MAPRPPRSSRGQRTICLPFTEEAYARIIDDPQQFRRALEDVCDRFGLPCPDDDAVPEEPADYESQYIACFEVGLPAAPVPLQASHYNRREPVPAVIHEHILFYRRFGMRQAADNAEPADHVLNEVAFLIHLDELLLAGNTEVESLLFGRRDFLGRQITPWLSRAAAEAEKQRLPATYRTLLGVLARATQEDLDLTGGAAGRRAREDA